MYAWLGSSHQPWNDASIPAWTMLSQQALLESAFIGMMNGIATWRRKPKTPGTQSSYIVTMQLRMAFPLELTPSRNWSRWTCKAVSWVNQEWIKKYKHSNAFESTQRSIASNESTQSNWRNFNLNGTKLISIKWGAAYRSRTWESEPAQVDICEIRRSS